MTSTPTRKRFIRSAIVINSQIEGNTRNTLQATSKSAAGTDSSHVSNSGKQQNLIVEQVDESDQSISLEASNHATQPIPDPISTHVPV